MSKSNFYNLIYLSIFLAGCTGVPSPWYMKGEASTSLLWSKSGVSAEQFKKDKNECYEKYKSDPSPIARDGRSAEERCFLSKGYRFTNYYGKDDLDYCRYVNPDGPACRSIGK